MKKIKLALIFGALVITCSSVLVSCNKEEINTVELKKQSDLSSIKVRKVNETLAFSTVEDYANAIEILGKYSNSEFELFENILHFKSLRSALSVEERKKINMTDDLLACLLNPNRMIQIENKLYEIDLVNEIANVYDSKSFSNFQKANSFIRSYSTDENVFGSNENSMAKGSACPNEAKKEKNVNIPGVGNVDIKVNYLRAAIYFSLHTSIDKDHWGGPLTLSYSVGSATSSYTKNKKNASKINIDAKSESGGAKSYSYRPYSEMVGLKQHKFKVHFVCTETGNSNYHINQTLEIDCN